MIAPEKPLSITRPVLSEKQPSLLSILILTILATTLCSFGIHQSGKIVTGVVEAVAREAVRDYPF